MSFKRRAFISSLAAAAVVPMVARRSTLDVEQRLSPSFLPQPLTKGARIGIACPASGVTTRELDGFIRLCLQHEFTPVLGRNVNKRHGYLAASDQDRSDELMAFVDDSSIQAIVCARGGYGVMRILPLLDYASIRQTQKAVVGFSDITALLIAINQLSGIVTFHGPVASSTFDEFTISGLTSVMMSTNKPQQLYRFQDDRLTTIVKGLGRGRLTGGNLSMIVSTLGTKYEIDTRGAILFLEEINEEPFRIDRMLTQLWLAGKLQTCSGIALGNFRNCEAKGVSITGPSFTVQQVIEQRTADLGIPVVYGLPVGHVRSKMTVPLGVEAELDATHKSLSYLGNAVSTMK